MNRLTRLMACVGLVAVVAQARTVALWPLNWDDEGGRIDGRCTIDAANNLAGDPALVCDWADATALGWELPPNPDTTGSYLFEPRLTSVVYSLGSANAANYAYTFADAIGRAVKGDRDFTLEGYFRVPELPADKGLFFIADCDGMTSGNRWFFTLRNNSQYSGVTWQIFSEANGLGDTLVATLNNQQIVDLTRGWHHFALTLKQTTSNVVWSVYQDGEWLGAVKGKTVADAGKTINGTRYFGLGGRNYQGNVFKGYLAYCRLSDEVLSPDQFLCATPEGLKKTLGFWPLSKSAADANAVDLSPSDGTTVHLTGSYFTWYGQYSDSWLFPDADCAFPDNPPNTTVTLADGNRGCLYSRVASARSTIRVNDLGKLLTLTNDFTVEGWIRPENRDNRPSGYDANHQLCETRISTSFGWAFQAKGARGQMKLVILAQDKSGYLTKGGDVEIGDLAAYEDTWVHVALSYRHDEGPDGRGVWRGYVNGTLSGCVTNTAAAAPDTAYEANFKFGLKDGSYLPLAFAGKFDCWRVSGAVLTPAQLLCASEGCEAATNVLALWPLNAINGIYIDGRDEVGSYTFETPRPANRRARACADGPVVPGLSAVTSGSVGFRVDDTTSRSMFICNDASIVNALVSTNGSTYEVYFKRTAAATSANEFFFIGYPSGYNGKSFGFIDQSTLGTPVDLCSNFTYSDTGFHLFIRGLTVGGSSADFSFKDSKTGQNIIVPVDTWVHLALTQRKSGTDTVFDLYLDGEKRSTITYTSGTPVVPDFLYIGGRPNTDNSFRGQMALLRISQGVLATNEFLCARSTTPETVAYWPLDYASGVDLTSAIRSDDGRHSFSTSSGVSGSSERARNSVPRPDATEGFLGVPGRNEGSIALGAAGYAQASHVGDEVNIDEPFTVEGWVKWANTAGAACEVIAGTYNGSAGGWKLVLDSLGETPMLRLVAQASSRQSVLADGVLLADASALRDTWTHLALVYDSGDGYGVWTLLVDGEQVGRVANRWRAAVPLIPGTFRLGAFSGDVSFQGGYDMWRISRGICGADDILWMRPRCTTIIFR